MIGPKLLALLNCTIARVIVAFQTADSSITGALDKADRCNLKIVLGNPVDRTDYSSVWGIRTVVYFVQIILITETDAIAQLFNCGCSTSRWDVKYHNCWDLIYKVLSSINGVHPKVL